MGWGWGLSSLKQQRKVGGGGGGVLSSLKQQRKSWGEGGCPPWSNSVRVWEWGVGGCHCDCCAKEVVFMIEKNIIIKTCEF